METSTPQRLPFWRRHRVLLILLAILLIAAIFRFTGTNFDSGTYQHPDERFIVGRTLQVNWPATWEQFTSTSDSPLNLRNAAAQREGGYVYGSLPVYMARGTAWLLDTVLPPGEGRPAGYYLRDHTGATLVGRHLAALFDLITILLVFLIGRRLFSSATGLIAAALVAFAVTHIQISHFYASDSFLVTFMVAALYFSVRMMQRPSIWNALGAGLFVGLAIASKVSIAPFALIVVAAVALRAFYRKRTRVLGAEFGEPVGLRPATKAEREMPLWRHLLGGFGFAVVAGMASVLAFVITEPYVFWTFNWSAFQSGGLEAVLNSNPWWLRLTSEADIQSGRADVPYTRQYVGTTPLLYHIEQMVLWGLGPVPGLVVVVGFAVGLWRAVRGKPAEILLMSGAVPYFATILTLEAKWMRYMLPLVPIFCLLGAAMLVRGIEWQKARWPATVAPGRKGFAFLTVQRNLFKILTAVTLVAAFLWAVAFMNIYSQEHSRIQASRWIHANVPDGAKISSEVWDDRMPLGVPGAANRSYGEVSMGLYDDRPPDAAFDYIKTQLAETDYIALASNRLYDSVDNLPWRYPVVMRYYDLLFDEKLGFEKVHTSQVTPELLGIKFDDQGADESFTVYDHPRVDVFKKVTQLTDEQLRNLFSPALVRGGEGFSAARHDKNTIDKTLLYEEPLAEQPALGDYAWNPLAQEETQWIGVLLWLLAAQIIGLLALPIVFVVCRNLPDKGYGFTKLVGLLVVTTGVWWLASARLVPFTVWSILLMIGLLGALSALCWRLGAGKAIREFYATRRSLVIFYEAVFFVTFGAFLILRMFNPDIWHPFNGGEKPMEFGFLNATLRSPWMPPADPFFAGGYINYYYHGLFIVGTLIKLVGVHPAIGFNLAIPLFYALTFTAAAAVVYNLVAWSQRRRGSTHLVSHSGMVFGVLSGVLVLAIGNLAGFWQGIQISWPELGRTVVTWAGNLGFREVASLPMLGQNASFDFWGPSRIIPGTINEFPFWSFLFADLHPHLINMPFTILAIGLGMNLAFSGPLGPREMAVAEGASWFEAARRRVGASLAWLWGDGWAGVLSFGIAALLLGLLLVTNSWDFPTYMGLVGGAVLIAVLRLRSGATAEDVGAEPDKLPAGLETAPRWTLYVTAAASVGLLAGLALLTYLPFFLHFKAFFTQILPLVEGKQLPTGEFMRRTQLAEFLVMWFIFVAVALSYLIARLIAYPWGNVILELRSLLKLGASTTTSPPRSGGPQQAFEQFPAYAAARSRRLALAAEGPSLAGPGATFSFRRGETATAEEPGSLQSRSDYEAVSDATQVQPDKSATNGTNGIEGRGETTDRDWVTGHITSTGTLPEAGSDLEAHVPLGPEVGYPSPRPSGGTWPDDHDPDTQYAVADWSAQPEAASQERALEAPPQVGIVPAWMGAALLALTAGLVALQVATNQYLLALLIGLLGGILATTLGGARSAAAHITGLLFTGALAVALGVEVVYLADHLSGGGSYRMNTVFKFYIQVWVLFGMACAAAVYFILYGVRDRLAKRALQEEREAKEDLERQVIVEDHTPSNGAGQVSDDVRTTRPLTNNWLSWADTEPLPSEINPVTGDGAPLSASGSESESGKFDKPGLETEKPQRRAGPIWSAPRIAWLGVFSLLLLMAFFYPLYGTPARIKDRFSPAPPLGTLNGLKFMTTSTFTTDAAPLPVNLRYDYEAIEWLNKNVSGLHTIAERVMGYYREYGMRVASNTGLPMVAGGLHQDEQRYNWMVGDRHRDMDDFYKTSDIQTALNIINKYDIDYIYVGQLEQGLRDESGPTHNVEKFEQMADEKVGILRRVFHADAPEGLPDTSIYQVIRDANTIVGAPVEDSGIPGISITPVPTRTPTPMPTPPSDDPELMALLADVAANPTDRGKRNLLIEWYRSHNYPLEAANELEALARLDPNDVAVRHQLGDAYLQANLPDKALKAWEDARDVDLNNPAGHNKVGIAYLERSRYDDAQREFQAAVDRDANFVEGWYHLGRTFEAKGDREAAKRAYETAVRNSPGPTTWSEEAQKRLNDLR
jgi:YYY domain-containing protein